MLKCGVGYIFSDIPSSSASAWA